MKAKALVVDKWVNCKDGHELDVEGPGIKIIHAFQMLCPGCVYRGIPQCIELYKKYNSENVIVVGLHTVFENHHAMTPDCLDVFIKEWRLPFPIGIDKRIEGNKIPETMKAYQLQGTPSLIIIDHLGEIQLQHFGYIEQEKLETFIDHLINNMT
ncbi:antioxidant, AhpC/TSA family [Bacteriovorax sp. BAL6_X]|uniref:peroxiredoxin family protein n=1 Tax=Bacteriovorax sp. BAL6_X TaxID=1201290 RepID=UPI00038632C9|nr:antioxidant, AhpC/TSA family [Bacteriovorax sp. BAL6_X]EPZ49904.1 antioxidant, AhpC/TSA family [Bacteriovorax sp. BAL6_X]